MVLALVIAGVMAFFPTASFLKQDASSWYIIQKQAAPASAQQHEGAVTTPIKEQPERRPALGPVRGEGCRTGRCLREPA